LTKEESTIWFCSDRYNSFCARTIVFPTMMTCESYRLLRRKQKTVNAWKNLKLIDGEE